ncbi:response regulator [Pedobacter frigiditerrae]|uniref:histidine kinase n=1 Tax=Pedobacter frigiditerrae TaxID=2530452 RepID=A0A4R0MMS2_9SPHI|nr:response regulator [Pedobacter frigiditerrae]TCC88020.1 response regulator [Pedobacter frigiditerrae]
MFKLSFKQQVLTGFAVSLTFVLISAISSYLSIKKLNEDATWQSHTYEVIDKIRETEVYLLNSGTGFRGYILTQREKYLTPYTQNVKKIIPTLHSLKLLVNDNPKQVRNVDSLIHYAELKIADMELVLSSNKEQGPEAAVRVIQTDKGKFFKDQILKISQQMINVEFVLLKQRKIEAQASSKQTTLIVVLSSIIIFGLILFLLSYIRRTFDQQKETEIQIRQNNTQLELLSTENEQKNWLLSGVKLVNEAMRGEQEIEELANNIISSICNYINAPIGAIFLGNKEKGFELSGAYAYAIKGIKKHYNLGDGFIGQVALEKKSKLLSDVPSDYIKISSGLGSAPPRYIHLCPVLFQNETIAVIELGLNNAPNEAMGLFLSGIAENVGIAINSAFSRVILRDLFEQTQQQAEELEAQQEELRTTNEELQASEEELRVQQEELRQTNLELEEKALLLEEKNVSINQAREAMGLKAKELEISSKYKSEFLANMSHELRTPLNSILILARILKENKPDNLNEDQIKYAGVIHNAGTDLLNLINDILDLSKIEAGKIDLSIETVRPLEVKQNMEALFNEVAKNKKVNFEVNISQNLPSSFTTDQGRLEQVIKNLLSNAFKFTPEKGAVTLNISVTDKETSYYSEQLRNNSNPVIAIEIVDTGIGISTDKQKVIFEAFQQADGSTSRKYGGTGLGLSISKEIAHILGGEIQIKSELGTGSTFTLFIPVEHTASDLFDNEIEIEEAREIEEPINFNTPFKIEREKNVLLIIEDDLNFADILKDYAIEKGFEPILAHSGDIGLDMAISQVPDAIILDIMLPVMDGWMILKKLKANPITKHIPVHIMSARDEKLSKAKQEGAVGFLKKPIDEKELATAFNSLSNFSIAQQFNKVLLIEDQETQSQLLAQQLLDRGAEVTQVYSGNEAITILEDHKFDCIILDLNLPDISGFDLLDKIKADPALLHIPVVINTAMELEKEQMYRIMRYSEAMVLKTDKSNDRLIDEVSLFMNKLNTKQKQPSVKEGKSLSTLEKALKDKTILVTDDDMRNIFALSTALQAYEMNIVIANNGREAIEKLEENPEIDLVLMDIMMPEMDGYEAMAAIRKQKKFLKLPIIALTAKAMKNDREKCIEAGANDYISKPVDIDKLLSMMRVWLSN